MKGEIVISTNKEEGVATYLLTLIMLMIIIIISAGYKICSNKEFDTYCFNELTSEVRTESIIVEGIEVGYLPPLSSKKEVLEELTSIYINKLNINEEDIISINVQGNIESEKTIINSTKIMTPREIAISIYNLCKSNMHTINVEIKTKEIEKKKIKPNVRVIDSKDLYMGESKEKSGVEGLKEIVKEVTYCNLEKKDEVVSNEVVVANAKDKIIYLGVKNPISEEVAFLSHPTGGGIITSSFGSRWNSFHKGIDIAGDVGDKVNVAIDGIVIEAGYNNGGYGNLVVIEHTNNIKTYYAHLSKINVKVGDKLTKGDKLGEIGSTGMSTGPHLHFELRVNDEPINPINYIK